MAEKLGDAYLEVSVRTAKAQKAMGGIQKRFARMGANLARIGKRAAIGFGVALAGGMAFSVKAAMTQEKAEKDLEAALRAMGDAVDVLLPRYKDLASSIQQQTTFGDEAVLSLMAQIRNLGVMPAQMEEATKGAIGLAKALKLDAATAARYTAMALQGETTILGRYVPALRTATTEAEKQKIVTDLMNRGYEQAQAETETVSGAMLQMRNNIGDAAEQIGFAIMNSAGFRDILLALSEKAKALTEKLKEMIAVGFFERMIINAKMFLNNFITISKQIWVAFKSSFTFIRDWAMFVGESIAVFFFNAVKRIQIIFTNLKDNIFSIFKAIWHKITHPAERFEMPDLKALTRGFETELITGPDSPPATIEKMWAEIDRIGKEGAKKEEELSKELAETYIERAKAAATAGIPAPAPAAVARATRRVAGAQTFAFAQAWKRLQEAAIKDKEKMKQTKIMERQEVIQKESRDFLGTIAGKEAAPLFT